eukprot:CAMPEP_0182804580 /NCGR_PEP_ID=MMETSP0006_2-20121128/4626_1 /TAXON_ID=97485 /ORGANISM="Prymnesium parvum, Strain Texoma1" /LENGTH=37 /DNA_ID= /DNA_START= /DNA_END= /DNA_ORIENTATION=
MAASSHAPQASRVLAARRGAARLLRRGLRWEQLAVRH